MVEGCLCQTRNNCRLPPYYSTPWIKTFLYSSFLLVPLSTWVNIWIIIPRENQGDRHYCGLVFCGSLTSGQLLWVLSRLPQGRAFQVLGLFFLSTATQQVSHPGPPCGKVTVSMTWWGETCHRDLYPTLFEEWQGIFYVQCPTDRAGGSKGGSVLGVRTPPPFWGNPKLHKEGKNVVCVCVWKCCVLVFNSYADPPPPFPKSCIRTCRSPNTWPLMTLFGVQGDRAGSNVSKPSDHFRYSSPLQGRIQDFGMGRGVRITVISTKRGVFARTCTTFFPPLYEVWGSPKYRGGGVLTPKTPPPWIRPCPLMDSVLTQNQTQNTTWSVLGPPYHRLLRLRKGEMKVTFTRSFQPQRSPLWKVIFSNGEVLLRSHKGHLN